MLPLVVFVSLAIAVCLFLMGYMLIKGIIKSPQEISKASRAGNRVARLYLAISYPTIAICVIAYLKIKGVI